jgi:uncharacterized protein YueI
MKNKNIEIVTTVETKPKIDFIISCDKIINKLNENIKKHMNNMYSKNLPRNYELY